MGRPLCWNPNDKNLARLTMGEGGPPAMSFNTARSRIDNSLGISNAADRRKRTSQEAREWRWAGGLKDVKKSVRPQMIPLNADDLQEGLRDCGKGLRENRKRTSPPRETRTT